MLRVIQELWPEGEALAGGKTMVDMPVVELGNCDVIPMSSSKKNSIAWSASIRRTTERENVDGIDWLAADCMNDGVARSGLLPSSTNASVDPRKESSVLLTRRGCVLIVARRNLVVCGEPSWECHRTYGSPDS